MSRKASDVLLALEAEVKKLTSQMSVIDNNVKIVLNRLNSSQQAPQLKPQQPQPAAQQPQQVFAQMPKDIAQAPQPLTQPTAVSSPQATLQQENRRVRQKIIYSIDKSPIRLATVEIIDPTTKKVVTRKHTNQDGFWNADLAVGNYIVRFGKTQIGGPNPKPSVGLQISIAVKPGTAIQALPEVEA